GYEVDQRLSNMELELLGYNRHLLTSNDRYQLAAAYLHLAQNRTTVMDAIYDGMSLPSQAKEKGEIDVDAVSSFLAGGYKSASELLEEADRILAHTGFQASPADSARLSGVMKFNWPGTEVLSSRFGAGIAEAASNLMANGGSLLQNTTANQLLPNDFRM